MNEQNVKSKNGWGGSRAGSGRPRKADRDCKIGFGVSVRAKSNLQAWAAARRLSLSDAATQIFEALEI